MGKFHDKLSEVFSAGEFYKGDAKAELLAAYDEDFSIPTAKITTLETDLANATTTHDEAVKAFNTERDSLKAKNYDLLMQIPAKDDPNTSPTPTGLPEKEITIEELFAGAAAPEDK